MTPEQAQDMLSRAQVDGELGLTAEMAARAPFMAEQIANMHYEYAVEARSVLGDYWERVTRWEPDRQLLFPKGKALVDGARIVRRLATDPEVVE